MRARHRHIRAAVAATACAVALAVTGCGADEGSDDKPEPHDAASAQPKASGPVESGGAPSLDGIDGKAAGKVAKGGISDEDVVGGQATTIDQLPWTVALRVPGQADNFCGGVLVAPTVVWTAAHCVQEVQRDANGTPITDPVMFGPDSIEVVAGRTRLDDSGGQVVAVKDVWQSADYNNVSFSSDYAILDLTQPVNQNYIALPRSTDTGLWAPGVRVVEAGWGCQIPDAWPNYACEAAGGSPLMFTTFRATDGSPCNAAFGQGSFDPETGLCMQNEAATDQACNGDSGGPYIVFANNNRWYLVATVSYGPTGCTLGKPVAGARSGHILDASGGLRSDLKWYSCATGTGCYYS